MEREQMDVTFVDYETMKAVGYTIMNSSIGDTIMNFSRLQDNEIIEREKPTWARHVLPRSSSREREWERDGERKR